ncbi:MAG: M15 family metallopeptidase [Nocardioides sp.]|nr:M15 family metallopeptidase [Nocardioides sp.]
MRGRHAVAGCAAAALIVLLAACGQEDGSKRDASGEEAGSEAPSASTTPVSDVPVADPDHAVDAPPPLKEPLLPADMLIYSQEGITDEMLEQIDGLKRVADTEQLSLAQVPSQNGTLQVAAVDPASYRRFTQAGQSDEIWQRVAGGELAISSPKLGKELENGDGYIKLGNDADAPDVHVGAYADQIPTVDAVINHEWGDELDMKEDNALLVSTGEFSPQSIQKKLQGIVGDASVQILGPDLPINAQQTAYLTGGSVADAVGSFTYRVLGGGRIQPDSTWETANIRTEQVPILGSVTCHKVMLPQLRSALTEVVERGLSDKIHPGEYAGCYYPRFIAGSTKLSLHSFGIALDMNVPGNQRGSTGEMDRSVVQIFKKWGFAWGGDWNYTDPMHFEMSSLVEAR